jgi:homoserine kinase type II
MAALTTFSEEALERYLIMFNLGELTSVKPIAEGIENSNYFVSLRQEETTEYVLTIIEGLSFAEVPFFNKVLAHLHQHGLPVAAPKQTLDGMTSTIFCGKPAFLFPRLPGEHLGLVDEKHCFELGEFLAASHVALESLHERRDNPYSAAWMHETLGGLAPGIPVSTTHELKRYITEYESLQDLGLPAGLIHGDLFRDNALFENNALTGVIDFYHACHDYLIQDLAIAINDWCVADSVRIDPALQAAMISGYESIRKLEKAEKKVLAPIQRTSAARFALTRFLSGDPPLKDPDAMLRLAGTID